jgi:hypothetical protein
MREPVPKRPDIKTPVQRYAKYLMEKENEGRDWGDDQTSKEATAYLAECIAELKQIQEELGLYVKTRKEWRWLFNRHYRRQLEPMLRQTRLHDVLVYLSDMATWEQTKAVAETLSPDDRQGAVTTSKGKVIYRPFILLRVNVEHAAQTLGMSKESVWRYLQAFVDYGVIKDHGRAGGKNLSKIYSLGLWQEHPQLRRLFYLKSTSAWRAKISGFIVRRRPRGM